MVIWLFLFYFVLFFLLFSLPGIRNREKPPRYLKLFIVPAVLGLIMAFLSLIKVYVVFKLLLIIFICVTGLLTYWQWGEEIRRWWGQ